MLFFLKKISKSLLWPPLLVVFLLLGLKVGSVLAQGADSVLYVPLIGISSVPDPLALPNGSGEVTFRYAVKNFLVEVPLSEVVVTDDKCSPVKFIEGDDNNDGKLDFSETWRFSCKTRIIETTQSTATVSAKANYLTATHKAFVTVVVGSDNPAPLVSIVNITKVAHPLSLPSAGGDIAFTYRVSNPGVVPLSDVVVSDDKCSEVSSKLGDTNGNNLLDPSEAWIYTCSTHLTKTTTSTALVTAFANGLKAIGEATLTVEVDSLVGEPISTSPLLPNFGRVLSLTSNFNFKITIWILLLAILLVLVVAWQLIKKIRLKKIKNKYKVILLVTVLLLMVLWMGLYFFLLPTITRDVTVVTPSGELAVLPDQQFGWKFPVVKFPITGDNDVAYSDIRDPGGIPQGLPVRLKIPTIGVDSAIEDALITPDGRMDVPAGSKNVAWFALGPHPGAKGSAVIGGHFGISAGVKFVFYDLDKLVVGDKLYVVDDRGVTLGFVVRQIKLFNRNDDATPVFISNDGLSHLNVITCEGVWNRLNDSYPQRRVVFTDYVSSSVGEATVLPSMIISAKSLLLGSKGVDVVTLQNLLVQKGFLVMPRGVIKGYFGDLTKKAVAKYQTSVGLPSNGIFGSATKLKLLADVSVVNKPALPTTAINPIAEISSPVGDGSNNSNVWTILIDSLITLVLVGSIGVIGYKIFKK